MGWPACEQCADSPSPVKFKRTPEGVSPYDTVGVRPEPLRRRSIPHLPEQAPAVDLHKRCREEILRLLAELEEAERLRQAEAARHRDEADALRAELASRDGEMQRLREENNRLKQLSRNTSEDLEAILRQTEARLREADEEQRALRKQLEILQREAGSVRDTLIQIHCECAVPFPPEPTDAAVYEQRLQEVPLSGVASSALDAVVDMRDRLLERDEAAQARIAELERALEEQRQGYERKLADLQRKLAYCEELIRSLEGELEDAAHDKKAALARLIEKYEKLLRQAASPIPERTRSPSPRNPRHWVPTGGGHLYQEQR